MVKAVVKKKCIYHLLLLFFLQVEMFLQRIRAMLLPTVFGWYTIRWKDQNILVISTRSVTKLFAIKMVSFPVIEVFVCVCLVTVILDDIL